MRREPQRRTSISPARPLEGYHNDLTIVARAHGSPQAARTAVAGLTADRRLANATSVAQLGLGAWQLRATDAAWLDVVRDAADWLAAATPAEGLLDYLFPLAHTYRLTPPWHSAMAQGEAVSLLLRAGTAFGRAEHIDAARRAVLPLIDPASPVVASTDAGPVLQEYPTDPPAHVLNGWIFALWGLYDAGAATLLEPGLRVRARAAFAAGCDALAARLPLYHTALGWSRYDLYPHPITHVASPFYHRLHVEQLAVMQRLHRDDAFARTIAHWERGARSGPATALAVGRKVAFRLVRPRRARVRFL